MAAQAAQDRNRCLYPKETAAAAYTSEEEDPEAPVGRYAQLAVLGMADTAVGSERCTMAGTCSEAQAGALAGTGTRSLRTGSEDCGREGDWPRLKPGCGSPVSRVAFRKNQACRIVLARLRNGRAQRKLALARRAFPDQNVDRHIGRLPVTRCVAKV